MADATFDGPNLLVTLPAPTGGFLTVDVQEEIYSASKEWIKGTGHQYPQIFDVTGGDPIPGGQFISGSFFLRNDLGWRIQTTDENQSVSLFGNLYPRIETIASFLPRPTRQIIIQLNLTANPRDLSSAAVARIERAVAYRQYTNDATGKLDIVNDDDTANQSVDIWEDDGVTPWDGVGPIVRRDKIL